MKHLRGPAYLSSRLRFAPARVTTLLGLLLLCLPANLALAIELVEVVKQVENTVVRVDTDAGNGSGVVVNESGLVLTNYHVIDGSRQVKLVLRNGKEVAVNGYLVIDPSHDLALLKSAPLPAGSAIKLAPQLPSVGEKVAAFGNPRGFSFTTSEGIVSAIRTEKDVQQTIRGAGDRSYGYATDATWVQTTAPISPGNSGGPLVTMNCELVGLNTWCFTAGQQLNFAISITDIKRVLAKVRPDTPVQNFDTLPRVRSTPIVSDNWYEELQPFRLELPTGRVFAFEVFRTNVSPVQMSSRGSAENGVVIKHPNGSMFAAANEVGGVLHGLTVAQYDNQEPMVHATYQGGRRHGILKTWDEAGDPVLFSQYDRGKRTGFTCLFGEGLEMIVQYKTDRVEFVQLMENLTPQEGFTSLETALKHPKAKARLERMEELDVQLRKNEAKFRKQVKEVEMDRRRELAAKLAPQKRARSSARASKQAAEDQAFINQIRKRVHGL